MAALDVDDTASWDSDEAAQLLVERMNLGVDEVVLILWCCSIQFYLLS
jgi:hypothetical protein